MEEKKYEIIQLSNTEAVVIGDKEPSDESWYISTEGKLLRFTGRKVLGDKLPKTCKKVIATIAPYKIEGLPMLELPNQEERDLYCWNKAKEIFEKEEGRKPNVNFDKDLLVVSAIQVGYKAATKNYSSEDIENIRNILVEGSLTNMSCSSAIVEFDKYFKSLQKKQFPIAVDLEYIEGKQRISKAKDGSFYESGYDDDTIKPLK